jgi:PST family polysaccharide transporter
MAVSGIFGKVLRFLAERHHIRRHFWQSLANYVQLGGGMVMGVILARLLLPEDFGRLVYISATVTILMIPFGITVTPLLITDANRTPGLFGDILGFMCITTVLKLLVVGVYIMWQLFFGSMEQALLAFLVGVPAALVDLPDTLRADLEGKGSFGPNLAVQVANVATHATVSIGLVLLGWGIWGLAIGGFACYWPQLLVYFASGKRHLGEARFDRTELVSLGRKGVSFWTAQFSTNVSARIDKIFLGKFAGDVQLGYYNRAFNYAPFGIFALSAFLTNASVVALRQQPTMSLKLQMAGKTALILFVGAALNWAVLWYFSDPLVPWVFGEQWRSAIPAFEAFSWMSMATAFHYLPMNFLLASSANSQMAIGKVSGLATLVILLAVLASTGGISSVSVANASTVSLFASGAVQMILSLPIVQRGLREDGKQSAQRD